MALVYTEIFADRVDERFYPEAMTAAIVNQDYTWDGAQTIKVTSIGTVANVDYDRNNGFTSASVLQNTIEPLTIKKDRGFKIVLDKMDEEETKIKAGEVLGRQLREVVIPEIEGYRLGKMLDAAQANSQVLTATSSPYEDVLNMNVRLDDAYVPRTARYLVVTPEFMASLKTDDNFVKASDIGQNIILKGQVGTIDGIPVLLANKLWLTDNATPTVNSYKALLVHKSATVAPIKLAHYEVLTSSEQYIGTIFMGRFYYDAFVLESKKMGIVGLK